MLRIHLTFSLPELVPSRSAHPAELACTLFEVATRTVLFVEAPNWANARQWSEPAALHAWGLWRNHPERLNQWNPSDLAHFHVYRLRPGFPGLNAVLWQDPFTYYEPRTRAATLVERLVPIAGTPHCQEQGAPSLAVIFGSLGLAPQALQHFDKEGWLALSARPQPGPAPGRSV